MEMVLTVLYHKRQSIRLEFIDLEGVLSIAALQITTHVMALKNTHIYYLTVSVGQESWAQLR